MEIFELVMKVVGIGLVGGFVLLLLVVWFRNFQKMFGTAKTVEAVVVKKYKVDEFTKYSGTGKKTRYVVVFEAGRKRLRLNASEFAYGGYRLNEKGTLTYKGNRIIEFK